MVDRHKLTVFYLKSFDMDSVQVGKAVLGKEIHTTLGIEPRTNSIPGRKRKHDKRKTDKKGDGSHLLDLDEILETNKSSSTLIVSSSTVMFIQIASES